MIKINKNDSLVDIISYIHQEEITDISLDFPFGHPILHNQTSLKIIKQKSNGKNISIFTSDKTAKNILKRVGITHSIQENSYTNKQEHIEEQYSVSEYLGVVGKKYKEEVKSFFNNINSIDYYKNSKEKGKIGFFLLFLLLSIFLFLFIFYFAVNKTYVYITPETTIKTRAKNFIFKELDSKEITVNPNIIKVKKIEKLIYLNDTFGVQGISKESTQPSTGWVTMYNYLFEKVGLLKNTRLQAGNNALFTTNTSFSIPPATKDTEGKIIPGTIDIKITANTYDSNGVFIGSRGNLEDESYLELPGLKTNKDKIYAKTKGKISGGNDNIIKSLSQQDIDNAKQLLEEKIKAQALKELKLDIEMKNKINSIDQEILSTEKSIIYSDFGIVGLEKIKKGSNIESFELGATIKITTYTYNKDVLLHKFQNSIKKNMVDGIEEIRFINNDSLRMSDTLYRNKKPFSIKATAEVEVFFIHNFLDQESIYINEFRDTIAGTNKSDAIKILLNNPKISDVEIDIRPFFIKKITSIPKNIIFKVEKN